MTWEQQALLFWLNWLKDCDCKTDYKIYINATKGQTLQMCNGQDKTEKRELGIKPSGWTNIPTVMMKSSFVWLTEGNIFFSVWISNILFRDFTSWRQSTFSFTEWTHWAFTLQHRANVLHIRLPRHTLPTCAHSFSLSLLSFQQSMWLLQKPFVFGTLLYSFPPPPDSRQGL